MYEEKKPKEFYVKQSLESGITIVFSVFEAEISENTVCTMNYKNSKNGKMALMTHFFDFEDFTPIFL